MRCMPLIGFYCLLNSEFTPSIPAGSFSLRSVNFLFLRFVYTTIILDFEKTSIIQIK